MSTAANCSLATIQDWEYWHKVQIGAQKEYGMSKEEFVEVLPEYQRFMALVAQGYTNLGMFSSKVDKVWHTHVLNMILYEHFCTKVFGRMIYHIPRLQNTSEDICKVCKSCVSSSVGSNEPTLSGPIAAEQFRNTYRTVYGELPGEIWDLPEADSCVAVVGCFPFG